MSVKVKIANDDAAVEEEANGSVKIKIKQIDNRMNPQSRQLRSRL